VDDEGEYFLQSSGGESYVLYYCPTAGANYEIHLTDVVGNVGTYANEAAPEWTALSSAGLTAYNAPNPFDHTSENTHIKFMLAEDAYVSIKVYDMAGSLVRTLKSDAHYSLGDAMATWDGLTDNGTMVATGVYLVHVEAKGASSGTMASSVVKVAIVKK
jgi:flagellar hook assembly protein FlgD